MRLASTLKLGYYPLPVEQGPLLRSLLAFPSEPTSALDPCAGTGAALHALTADSDARLYGVELDAIRAAAAKDAGIDTIHGNIQDVGARVEKLGFLYLNPPYDSEVGPLTSLRMEQIFLSHTYSWLRPKGVLLMVIPHKVIFNVVDTLSARFRDLRVFRMVGEESEKYDQIALFGVRHNNNGRDAQNLRDQLLRAVRFPSEMPALTEDMGICYSVPPSDEAQLTYVGIPLDEVEDRLPTSPAWKYVGPLFLPKQEKSGGQPITPLHGGHVGLLATAGMLNGTFGEGEMQHIARWRPVKHTTTSREIEGDTEIIRTKERFSNELAIVFRSGNTLVLTETKKKEETDTAEVAPTTEETTEEATEEATVVKGFGGGLFSLGRQAMTPGIQELVVAGNLDVFSIVSRHVRGDWGDLSRDDKQANDDAVADGESRILSSYNNPASPDGKVWIITEGDRSVTTLLLPSEY